MTFLSDERARELGREFGTPLFVYDRQTIERQAERLLAFPNAFGLTARYAMKACPVAAVLKVFRDAGLHIDASSGYEVERALRAGIPAGHIQITAQELPANLGELVGAGILFNACSIEQIRAFGRLFPRGSLSIRVNPGLGSGHSQRTNVGGPSSSFGIWHDHLDEALAAARAHDLVIEGMHSHIGSGTDPAVWQRVALMTLDLCARVPSAVRLSLGGGFKIGRMPDEPTTDLQAIGRPIADAFRDFARRHGRELRLEVEPGTYLMANAGVVIATVVDVVDTGAAGYRFVKVDTGMTEVLRPSLYGAQHPIEVVPASAEARGESEYLVVGHCCESGDLLTPAPGEPEAVRPRRLREARIGDLVVIHGAGAYCDAMAATNYNSFPRAAAVMLRRDGRGELIRKRETLDQILQNEIDS